MGTSLPTPLDRHSVLWRFFVDDQQSFRNSRRALGLNTFVWLHPNPTLTSSIVLPHPSNAAMNFTWIINRPSRPKMFYDVLSWKQHWEKGTHLTQRNFPFQSLRIFIVSQVQVCESYWRYKGEKEEHDCRTCRVGVSRSWPTGCRTAGAPAWATGPPLRSTATCWWPDRGGCASARDTACRCGRSGVWRSASTFWRRSGAPAPPPGRPPESPFGTRTSSSIRIVYDEVKSLLWMGGGVESRGRGSWRWRSAPLITEFGEVGVDIRWEPSSVGS